MSTTELFMEPEDVEEFVRETKAGNGYSFGYEGQEKGICPFITFYIYQPKGEQDFLTVADAILNIAEEFEKLKDEPYKLIYKDSTQVWLRAGDKRLPTDWREHARRTANGAFKFKSFWYRATTGDTDCASARWAICGIVTDNPTMCYSTLKLTFRHKWYLKNKDRWHSFVQKCVRILQPDQSYSGFEVGNGGFGVLGSFEGDVMERISADYFYGLDIDKPMANAYQYFDDADGYVDTSTTGAGLRPPTWCFALSPYWLKRLNLTTTEVYQALSDSRIRITEIPYFRDKHNPDGSNGLWIQLGDLDLYPIEDGVPELLVKANALIRPVRCDYLKLTDLDRWDDDPNPVFDEESSERWMQRFDADSDWPSPEVRNPPAPTPPPEPEILSALPGQVCPRSGTWMTTALLNKRSMQLTAGERMPSEDYDRSGNGVIWYWKQA